VSQVLIARALALSFHKSAHFERMQKVFMKEHLVSCLCTPRTEPHKEPAKPIEPAPMASEPSVRFTALPSSFCAPANVPDDPSSASTSGHGSASHSRATCASQVHC